MLLKRWSILFLFIALIIPVQCFADGDDVDFDDDGKDDFVVYRPSFGAWFIDRSDGGDDLLLFHGLPGDTPVPGQYTDNLRPDIAVYRSQPIPVPGLWFIRKWDSGLTFSESVIVQWGGFSGDVVVPCDWNRNSKQDLGIFRNGTWYLRYSDSSDNFSDTGTQAWGQTGDVPVPRDWDNDGQCDYTVFRNGTWYTLLSSTDYEQSGTVAWGQAGDTPIGGEFDGDSFMDIAVYREGSASFPSQWIIRESSTQGLTSRTILWGTTGDVPMTHDIDDDNQMDITVFRDGSWFTLLSDSNFAQVKITNFGLSGDTGLARRGGPLN